MRRGVRAASSVPPGRCGAWSGDALRGRRSSRSKHQGGEVAGASRRRELRLGRHDCGGGRQPGGGGGARLRGLGQALVLQAATRGRQRRRGGGAAVGELGEVQDRGLGPAAPLGSGRSSGGFPRGAADGDKDVRGLRRVTALGPDYLLASVTQTYPCQLSFGQLSLGFAPPPSRQARDAALGANASETLAAPGTLDRDTMMRTTGNRFCTRAERVL